MENANIAPFYVGQKVVYITGVNMPKDSIHTISDIYVWPCGCVSVEINGSKINYRPLRPGSSHVECGDCGKELPTYMYSRGVSGGSNWDAKSFRPLQQQNFPLIKLSEIRIKETEKVEPILIGEN